MNYNEAVSYIFGLRKFGGDPGVVRAAYALELLGNPQKGLQFIHVAGTNGKGSVCAYMESTLRKMGFSVGLFTSPHLVRVNERVRINGELISDDDFMECFEKVQKVSEQMEQDGRDGLAFFDYVFVLAMVYFAKKKPDIVILETGLGGKLDATSAIKDKLMSVITSISYDHTEILGDTLEQIAGEKAGIIVKGAPVVAWKTNDSVAAVFSDVAEKCDVSCHFVDEKSYEIARIGRNDIDFSIQNEYYRNSLFQVGSIGIYQVMNATLAATALQVLASETRFVKLMKEKSLEWTKQVVIEGIRTTKWEGRMEEVMPGIFVDGAHNSDGIEQFLKTAKQLAGKNRLILLFGAVCEKNHDEMIHKICDAQCFDEFVITKIDNKRALDLSVMQSEFEKYTTKQVYAIVDNREAFEFAKKLAGEQDILLCAGSLYLVGAIKALIGE